MKCSTLIFILTFALTTSLQVYAQPATKAPTAKADSLFFAGNWKEAATAYEASLVSAPEISKNPVVFSRLGFSYQNLLEYDRALTNYRKAEALHPTSPVVQIA